MSTKGIADPRQPLQSKHKLGYSMGSLAENLAYNFYYLFFIYFLTDFAGMSPGLAGTVSLVSVAWDAVTDPYIGFLSDKSTNPKGRRRPWIKRFAVPLGIMIVLLFVNVPLTGTPQFIYFIVANMIFWMLFTAVDIPFMVLGSEITRDEAERTSLRWMCNVFNYASYGFSGYTLTLTFLIEKKVASYTVAWAITALVIAIIVAVSFLIAYKSTEGREDIPSAEQIEVVKQTNLFQSIKQSLKVKPYVYLLLYTLFAYTGIMLFTSDEVYIFQSVINASEFATSNLYLGYAIIVMLMSPVFGKLAIKYDNRRVTIIGTLICGLGFVLYKFIPLTMVSVWGLLVANACGATAFFVNGYTLVYDVAEVGGLKTQNSNEGVMVSFFSFTMKFSTAVGMWLLGIILEFYKYDPVNLTESGITGIINCGTIISGVIIAIGAFFIYKYKIGNKELEILRKMRASGNIDQAIIDEML